MINLLKTELWRCFSLSPPEIGIYDLLPRPSSLVFSLSLLPLSNALSPPKSLRYRSLASRPVADMPDSPEAALHFIFMYDPMTSTATKSSNHPLYLEQHTARLCRCVPLFKSFRVAPSFLPFQPFVRHIDPARPLALMGPIRRHRRLGLDHQFQPRVALHMESCVDSGQGRLPVLSVREPHFHFLVDAPILF